MQSQVAVAGAMKTAGTAMKSMNAQVRISADPPTRVRPCSPRRRPGAQPAAAAALGLILPRPAPPRRMRLRAACLAAQINLPELQKTMQEFQMQNEKMEMSQEMMDDAMDSMFDDEDEDVRVHAMHAPACSFARVLLCRLVLWQPLLSRGGGVASSVRCSVQLPPVVCKTLRRVGVARSIVHARGWCRVHAVGARRRRTPLWIQC